MGGSSFLMSQKDGGCCKAAESCDNKEPNGGSKCETVRNPSTIRSDDIHSAVSEYYGSEIKSTSDLKFCACVSKKPKNKRHNEILQHISPKVLDSFYGCGSPIPEPIEGATIVDLGSGTGRDCFVMSVLSGRNGRVIGVDMTAEQIEVAVSAVEYHKSQYPLSSPLEFRKGFIEDLAACGISDSSVDVVISNCVINLSAEKKRIFSEIFRILKEGGEVCISDIFADRTLPEKARHDKVLVGECIGNAMNLVSFVAIMKIIGFKDLRVVESRRVPIEGVPEDLIEPGTQFFSITFSAFKGVDTESHSWEGEFAQYNGGIQGSEEEMYLDLQQSFHKGVKRAVPKGIYSILSLPRFQKYFTLGIDNSLEAPSPVPDFMDVVFQTNEEGSCCCCSGGKCH